MSRAQSRAITIAILAVTVATAALAYMSWRQNQISAFASSARVALVNIDLVLDRAVLIVRAVRGLYQSEPDTDEDTLVRFLNGIGPVTGLRGIVFYRRIRPGERAAFELELKRTGKSPIGLWSLDENGARVPVPAGGDHYAVAAGYLSAESSPAYGYDVRSHRGRRFAVDMAAQQRVATSTDVVTFVIASDRPAEGVIFYKPVVVDRDVVGLVSGSVDLQALIAAARAASPLIADIDVEIGPLMLRPEQSVESPKNTDTSTPFVVVDTREHAGREWRIELRGRPQAIDYARGYGLMTLILLAGAGTAAAVAGYTAAAQRGRDLKAAERRLRRTLDGLVPLVFLTDRDGMVIGANRAAQEAMGESEDAVGRPIDVLPLWSQAPERRDALHAAIVRAADGFERRLDVPSAETDVGEAVYDVAVRPVAAEDGTVSQLVVSALDVTERVEAAETERLLMRELDHRMKNTLQVVQGVVRRTADSHTSVDAFEGALLGRITTMARAHDLLARGKWLGADLRTVVLEEIQPFEHGRSITISGPPIRINPKGALAFALAVHELGTNAAKYGALSVPEGRLEVDWAIEGPEEERTLVFEWRESDGPPVKAPERRGFGSLLLERSITYDLDGRTQLDFHVEGLTCRIDLPWERVRPLTASTYLKDRRIEEATE